MNTKSESISYASLAHHIDADEKTFKHRPNIDIRRLNDNNGFAFYFDRLFISDIHWGTKHCNAEMLNVFLDLVQSRQLSLGGDILDLEKMTKWKLEQSHKNGMAKIFQKANENTQVDFKPGNHDEVLRGRRIDHNGTSKRKNSIMGKKVHNIHFHRQETYIGPDGRKVLNLHGDEFDPEIAKDKRGFWYNFFDGAYTAIQNMDWYLNKIGIPSHIGPTIKKLFKNTINSALDYYHRLDKMATKKDIDVVVHGHAHNMGFEKTKAGILKIDDGCATDHAQIQALGQNPDGTFVLITMIDGKMRFEDEKGKKSVIDLKKLERKLNCEGYTDSLPIDVPEKYQDMLNSALRPVYRMSPPKKRQKAVEQIRADRRKLIEKYKEVADNLNLDKSITSERPTIAASLAFQNVHALPPNVITENWEKGLKTIYKLAGRITETEEKIRPLPIPKKRIQPKNQNTQLAESEKYELM